MWTIRQNGNVWQVLAGTEQVGGDYATYDDALGAISPLIGAQLAEANATSDGTLTGQLVERWTSTTGVAFSEPTGDGRDFTQVVWSWRDPAVYPLPLMDQTETEIGHFGAVLAGFVDTVEDRAGTLYMGGGFYDSDAGRAMRDRMLSNRTGVSLDPGAVEAEFECLEYDDDGWCNEGQMNFLAYQAIGLTGTPFPGFENATIEMEGAPAAAAPAADDGGDQPVAASFAAMVLRVDAQVRAEAVTASGAPAVPPAGWFLEPEPEVGDPRLVEQRDGSLACPLTITDDGQFYGHLARWGQCHVGNPQGPDICTEPPESSDTYPGFHLGHVICDDGTDVPTGVMVAGCDHASTRLAAPAARDHYAHNGAAWGDSRATNGVFGPWVAGALRPDVSDVQLRVLRASSLSGDWRPIEGVNELILGLLVNGPGFPIERRALVASGWATAAPRVRAHIVNNEVQAIVAAGVVTRCPECERRAALARQATEGGVTLDTLATQLAGVAAAVETIDRRTIHLGRDAALAIGQRLDRTRRP